MKDVSEKETCPRDDIAAYVDGELTAEAASTLERHVDGCDLCSRSLREQRQFLAALSASLDDAAAIELPKDFTKRIVTNAESSVSGIRRPNELFTAVCISAALFLFVLFAFGGETLAIAAATGTIVEKLVVVAAFVVKLAANAVFALAVVSSSLASWLEAPTLPALLGLTLAGVVVLSSRRMLRRRDA